MRDLLKKAGSLLLGAVALGSILVSAAVGHGCQGARQGGAATQHTRVDQRPTTPAPPLEAGSSEAQRGLSENDESCQVRSYMPATKAPVFVPPECWGKEKEVKAVRPANGLGAATQQGR